MEEPDLGARHRDRDAADVDRLGGREQIAPVDRQTERPGHERAVDVDLEAVARDDAHAFAETGREVRARFAIARPPARRAEERDRLVEATAGDEDVDVAERALRRLRVRGARDDRTLEGAVWNPTCREAPARVDEQAFEHQVDREHRFVACVEGSGLCFVHRPPEHFDTSREMTGDALARHRIEQLRELCVIHRFRPARLAGRKPFSRDSGDEFGDRCRHGRSTRRRRSAGTSTAPTTSSEPIVPSAATTYAVGVPNPSKSV